MRWRDIELLVVCTFLMLAIAEFIQVEVQIRIFGPNLLHPRIWQYAVIFVIMVSNPQAFTSKTMVIIYIYTIFYVLMGLVGYYLPERYEIAGKSPYRLVPLGWAVIVLMREHYFRQEKLADLRIVLKVAWFAFILACLTSLFVIIRNPGAVRGTEVTFIEEDVRSFRGSGLGGYGFFSSLPFLIPIIFYYLKNHLTYRKGKTLSLFVLLGLFLYTSYKGVIIAPFLIAITTIILSALGRRRFRSSLAIVILIVLTFTLMPKNVIGGALIDISEVVPNRDMSTKFRDLGVSYITGLEIVESAEGSSNTVEHRASRIATNLDQFRKYPLLGAGVQGNPHLFWLNQLAHFGLIGIFPLIWLLVVLFGYIKKFDDEYKFYYFLSFLSYVFLLFIKANGGYHFMLAVFFIAPGSYYLSHDFSQSQVTSPEVSGVRQPATARNRLSVENDTN